MLKTIKIKATVIIYQSIESNENKNKATTRIMNYKFKISFTFVSLNEKKIKQMNRKQN